MGKRRTWRRRRQQGASWTTTPAITTGSPSPAYRGSARIWTPSHGVRDWSLSGQRNPDVFLDATFCKARVNRWVGSQAEVIATAEQLQRAGAASEPAAGLVAARPDPIASTSRGHRQPSTGESAPADRSAGTTSRTARSHRPQSWSATPDQVADRPAAAPRPVP